MESKGRYAVQKILRSVLLSGMEGIGQSGWEAVEFGSPEFINFNKVLTMQLMRQKRVGWQGWNYELSNLPGKIDRKDEWIAEYHWQIQILLKRPESITEESVVAEDVADLIIAWLNGPGIEAFKRKGVAPLRIDGASVFVYNDNSDLYQKRAVFTVKIQVPKTLTTGENVVDALKPDVQPV